jgi:hypothetical protein
MSVKPLTHPGDWRLILFAVFPKEQSTTTVVFFLGGCTFTEIAAIRWMGKRTRGMHSNGDAPRSEKADIYYRQTLCDRYNRHH